MEKTKPTTKAQYFNETSEENPAPRGINIIHVITINTPQPRGIKVLLLRTSTRARTHAHDAP